MLGFNLKVNVVTCLTNNFNFDYNPNTVWKTICVLTNDSSKVNMLTPREKRHQRTRDAILQAAREIIMQKGPDKLSMRALARRIDYSPAGLYEYFGSKEEIITAVCGQGHGRLYAAMAHVDKALPAREYLVEIGLAYIQFAVSNPDYFLLMFTQMTSEATEEDMQMLVSEQSSFSILLTAVERLVAEGLVVTNETYSVLSVAYSAWAMVHGIAMLRVTFLRDVELVNFTVADRETLRAFGLGLGQL